MDTKLCEGTLMMQTCFPLPTQSSYRSHFKAIKVTIISNPQRQLHRASSLCSFKPVLPILKAKGGGNTARCEGGPFCPFADGCQRARVPWHRQETERLAYAHPASALLEHTDQAASNQLLPHRQVPEGCQCQQNREQGDSTQWEWEGRMFPQGRAGTRTKTTKTEIS